MKAIITGITGQDGYYMMEKVLSEGFHVLGLTSNLHQAQATFEQQIGGQFELAEFDYVTSGEFRNVVEDFRPNYIFNFAAKATGQGMFDDPRNLSRLNGEFVVDILEALRQSSRRKEIILCQASSSEMYGDVDETPQTEQTPFRPKSPYGVAKLYAHNMIKIYRSTYGIRCCSAILYNHESVRRSVQFVTKKIANAAAQIKLGVADSVTLGSLGSKRDWGYAPEYVDAMFRMASADSMEDYVVATGRLSSVRDLCEVAFGHLQLDYLDYVKSQSGQIRLSESVDLLGDPEKIRKNLRWSANKGIEEIMIELVDNELAQIEQNDCFSN